MTRLDPLKSYLINYIATKMKLSKFSVVFIFSNWLYSSKRKLENAGSFSILENFDFVSQALIMKYKWL